MDVEQSWNVQHGRTHGACTGLHHDDRLLFQPVLMGPPQKAAIPVPVARRPVAGPDNLLSPVAVRRSR